jgi:hypothetical protein
MGEALDFDSIGEETAVVVGGLDLNLIRPRFAEYKSEAERIVEDANSMTVQDQDSLNVAVMIGGNAKKIGKAIDAQRKAIILEPSEFVKGVNSICKMITDQLDEAERTAKGKISQYQARVEMERRERERKAREEAEALQRKLDAEVAEANRKAAEEARRKAEEEARARKASDAEIEAAKKKAEEEAAKIAVIAPTVVTPVVQEAPKVTRTESGSASQRKVWTFEVQDPAQVPREYLMVDEKKIRDAVRMGVRDIPGVRIYEDSKTVFRT